MDVTMVRGGDTWIVVRQIEDRARKDGADVHRTATKRLGYGTIKEVTTWV